jgi:hypothetical protein
VVEEVEWKSKVPGADCAGPTRALLALGLLKSGVWYSSALAGVPPAPGAEERRSWLRRNGVSSKV